MGVDNKGDIKQLYHGLSTCTRDNALAKARGLSPRTGGQTTWYNYYIPPSSEKTLLSLKYFMLKFVVSDEGGILYTQSTYIVTRTSEQGFTYTPSQHLCLMSVNFKHKTLTHIIYKFLKQRIKLFENES